MAYTIVPSDAASAREAVLELWRRNFPEAPAGRYAWLYESGQAAGFLLHTGDGLAVGASGIMRRDFRAFGKVVRGGQSIDLNVNREHRLAGPARKLQHTVMDAVAAGEIDLAYGFPNRQSEAVVRRSGYQTLGELGRWVKPLSSRLALDRWSWPTWLRRSVAGVLDPCLRWTSPETRIRRPRDSHFLEVEAFDARFDRLWEAAAPHWPILGERTSDYLTWRFSRCPDMSYRAMCAADSRGELLGYVIYGHRGETAFAADFLVADLRHLEPLLAEFLRLARRRRAHKVVVLHFGRPEVARTLERLGFWRRPSGRKVMLYIGAAQGETAPSVSSFANPANWHLTGADIDTDG